MRTKTLLLSAAAIAAGVLASEAQTVFSANAVGYVNLSLPAGYSMIANPLNGTNNNLSTVLPSVPDGTSILKFDPATQQFAGTIPTFIEGLGWFPDGVLAPGEGAFILLPSAATLTFIGEVPQGNLSQPVSAGYSIQASQVPQQGQLTADLGFPGADGDSILRFDNATQTYSPVIPTFIDGLGWFPEDPEINVAESFFALKTVEATWTRTFNVNN